MSSNHTIILSLFTIAIPLLSMNQYKELSSVDNENELQLIKPTDYIIAIHYPAEINKGHNHIALGILDPEETTEYQWCPDPYSDRKYNKKRRDMSLASGIFSCCIVGCKMWLMYNECIAKKCFADRPESANCEPCLATYTCQEVWWPIPCSKEFDTFCITGIENGQTTGTMGIPGTCTMLFIASSLCALYSWMPCHNKDGCSPYKKVVKKVFRRKRNHNIL